MSSDLYTKEQRNRYVQNCGQVERFHKIVRDNTVTVDGVEAIAYGSRWYRIKISDSGVPYPSRIEVETDWPVKQRDSVRSVWNFSAIPLEWVRYDLKRCMFYEWGHGSEDANENWVWISMDGEVNYPIDPIKKSTAKALQNNLVEWVEKGRGKTQLTFCEVSTIPCKVSFSNPSLNPSENPGCPFARVYASRCQKWSCCRTVKCEGVMLDQIEEVFSEVLSKDMVLKDHPQYIEAMTWLGCMIAFLERSV